MSDSIVSAAHLRTMFDRLNALDNLTMLEMSVSHGYLDHQAVAIVKAYRALLSDVPPVSQTDNQPVRCLGIVGASSVPTALWPYLLLAHFFNIPVKIKLPGSDLPSVNLLKDIITRVTKPTDTIQDEYFESNWDVSTQAGDVLVSAGFWDDCDRILVFGSDATLSLYRKRFPEPGMVIGFGHTESILVLDLEKARTDNRWMADLLAFGHRGCLAPHLVIPCDHVQSPDLAALMLSQLNERVEPDIERAISLRHRFHELKVHEKSAWLSADGMWLASHAESITLGTIPGHLQIVNPSLVMNTDCNIGALSMPEWLRALSFDLDLIQARATWKCRWGSAQFPTLNWCNSGVPILTTITQ
ncbi:MAG: acyl-CoA reductase [Armatimonadaceae bacterium]